MRHQRTHISAAVRAAYLLIAGLSAAGVAQAEPVVQSEAVRVSASRVERELMDVNMSVSVITRQDIERSSARNVGELLESVAGIQINNDGGQGMKRVSIRGENAFRTVVMIDGHRVAEHKSMSGAPMLISPADIERIEVIKGPASVLYGSDAIGGAINIITKKGGDRPVQGEVSAGLNTSASGKSLSGAIYGQANGWKYRLSAGIEDNEALKTPVGEMPNTYFSSRNGSAFVSYDINDDATVGMTLDHFDLEFGSGSFATPGFAVDVPEWTRTKVAAFGEWRNVTDNFVRLRTDAFYQKSKKDMVNTVPMAGVLMGRFPYNGYIWPIANNETDQYGFSVQTDWQLGENHYLVAGYEMSFDDLSANSITRQNWMKQIPLPMFSRQPEILKNDTYDGHQLSHAVYASMESQLPADLTLTYGVRYTWVKSEMDIIDNLEQTKESKDSSDGKAVFNLGLLWHGTDNLSLRANYAQGYRNPILQELYIDTNMGQDGTTYANADLKPEESDNFELGARWVSQSLQLDAAAFYSKADNYIATVYKNNLRAYQYDNVAKAKTFGLELSGSVSIDSLGLEPYAVITWMRRQYDNGAGFKTYETATPELMARYGVRYRTTAQGLNLRTDLYANSYTATEYRSASGNDDYRLPGFTTLNFTAGVAFGPQDAYSFDMGLYNIFDKGYRKQQSIYEPGRYLAVKLNAKF